MWSWFTFYLIVHILAVLVAFGPVFGYPVIAAMIAKQAPHAAFGVEIMETLAERMTLPIGVIVALSGTGLIYTAHVDLWKSEWLIIALILYTAAYSFGLFVQLPTETKMLRLLHSMPAGPPAAGPGGAGPIEGAGGPPPEAAALSRRLRMGGMYLTFSVVTILVLMIWQPGGAFR
jgi:hypothetical protein